jgi:hypothetical protein
VGTSGNPRGSVRVVMAIEELSWVETVVGELGDEFVHGLQARGVPS